MFIKPHTIVRHKKHGLGRIVKVVNGVINVEFEGKTEGLRFTYPDAFEKGGLTVESGEVNENSDSAGALKPLTMEDIRYKTIVIRINKNDAKEGMSREDLYEAARGRWTVNLEHAKQQQYAFAVHDRIVLAVFKPTAWYICDEAPDGIPRKDEPFKSEEDRKKRKYFIDQSFENGDALDDYQQFCLGKSIEKLPKNIVAGPFFYLEPETKDADGQ